MNFAPAPNSLEERAQSLFQNELADESTVKHNVEAWLNAVSYLGDKWLLAKPVTRITKKGRK